MITRRRPALPGLLGLGLLLLLVSIVPVFAKAGESDGPLYSSTGDIAHAQSVLKAEHYLTTGWQPGKMDRATIDALRGFQRDHFIPASGLLDQETMAQLSSHESYRGTAATVARAQTAPAASTSPGEGRQASQRTMPETASPIPLMTALGILLVGAGILLMRRRRA